MALRLVRQVNRNVKGTTYYKWRIGELPKELVEKLGWEPGTELDAEIRENRLILKPRP